MRNKNKKVVQAAVAIVVVLAFVMSGSATFAYKDNLEPTTTTEREIETAKLVCQIDGKEVVKELSVETINEIIELAESCEKDFYTIYNKWETDEDVDIAFGNIQPFFQAVVDSGLTDKSVEDLSDMFRNIRSWIKKPPRDPSPRYENEGGEDVQPNLYIWNGLPTPFAANAVCGVYTIGTQAFGFALGTHTLLPTLGIDIFNTWIMTGNGGTIGALGFTQVAITEFACDFGFVGMMLGVWTSGVIAPFLLQIGFAALFFGVSIA